MDRTLRLRIVLALVGALAGVSFYILADVLQRDVLNDRFALGLTAFAAAFFGGLMAMTGPLLPGRAALSSLGLAVPVAGLLVLASLRYDTVADFLSGPFGVFAGVVVASVPLPFLIAAAGPGWRDYPALFNQSWNIVVRYASAWLFVAVVWAVIFLSDALLGLVGVKVVAQLIEVPWVPWLVTGLVLGLALAVVTELSDYVSPFLILRLLRLLLPVVVVVMGVFILALPLRGLSGLFGALSPAATLLGMCLAAATLVTTAVDQGDVDAVSGRIMAAATEVLALILPIPAALAGWAVALRVDQYGWTPPRLAAALAVVVALGYGLLYAGAVVMRTGWMGRVRQANTVMALVLVALSALWLTPVLNAERISARNQLARFADGRTSVAQLDLQALRGWGQAGEAVLATLRTLAAQPEQAALAERFNSLAQTRPTTVSGTAGLRAELGAALPVRPETATAARDALLDATDPDELQIWLAGCHMALPDGRPGCVLVAGDFDPGSAGLEMLLVLRDGPNYVRFDGFILRGTTIERRGVINATGPLPDQGDGVALIGRLLDGPLGFVPAPLNVLRIDGRDLMLLP